MSSEYEGFGRTRRAERSGRPAGEVLANPAAIGPVGVLPFGNGRSYGDTCHNDAGVLADFRTLNRILAFDVDSGILEVEPGVMLHEVIDRCATFGWFLPVTPGTRFVTVGGAVANDVHGKNHHRRGTFGCHVLGFEIARSDAPARWVGPGDRLFAATVGGMGLTGFITRVRLQMMRVGSLDIEERVTPFSGLEEYFDHAADADEANEYAVAWLDQLASGGSTPGVLLTGNHAGNGNFASGSHRPKFSVPVDLPFNALNPLSLRAFNTAFLFAKKRKAGRLLTSNYSGFFYPLDAVRDWNRLYGPRGLFQHQSVIPAAAARTAVPELIAASRDAGEASFLTVLKRFGHVQSPGILSFPAPGYTLTLDFPNRGASTLRLLDRLDGITITAGGRVNPYKDARMSARTFAASFPRWREIEAMRDPAIVSDFWRRTALVLGKSGESDNFNDRFQPVLTPVT